VVGAASLWLPRGLLAVSMACVYAVALVAVATARLLERRSPVP